MGIDSENDLSRKLPSTITSRIERSVYIRKRGKLADHMDKISLKLASHFNESEDYFIVDSMPLEVYKRSRSSRSKICKEQTYSYPDKGYCASQGSTYYGYKLHAIYSVNGVFQSLDLSPASVHDIHYLKDIKSQINDCKLIADKGYLPTEIQLNLFENYIGIGV